jgi:hypothetical protein
MKSLSQALSDVAEALPRLADRTLQYGSNISSKDGGGAAVEAVPEAVCLPAEKTEEMRAYLSQTTQCAQAGWLQP